MTLPSPYQETHPSALALQTAIGNCYYVFAPYEHFALGEGSPLTVTDKMRLPLETKPLRLLSERDLNKFVFKVLSTWGGEDDLRHFLPRILELIAGESFTTWLGIYHFLHKLDYAKWWTWPQSEQSVIEAYCKALWRYILDVSTVDEGLFCPSHTFLGEIYRLFDIQPYLDSWGKSPTEIKHLANLALHYATPYKDSETAVLYHVEWLHWSKAIPGLRKWLVTKKHLDMLEDEFFHYPESELLSMAVDILYWTLKQEA